MPMPLQIAQGYVEVGLAPFALPYGQKRAVRWWRRWQDVPPSQRELEAMFDGDEQNIAIISGRASGGLLVLDADNQRTFTEVAARLRADGIETWVVQRPANGSPHDGGGHLYLRTPRAVKSARIGSALEIKGQGKYVLAPPSLHPQGGLYQFVDRPSAIFTLPSLGALEWLKLMAAPPRRRISSLAWRILKGDAESLANYPTRSEAEAALCASLARAGFDAEDALRLLLKYPGPGKFRELHAVNSRNARRYLYLTWQNAREFIETHDSEASRLAKRLRAWATSRPWPGRSGSTDRAIYLAHLTIVERCGRDPHGASARELGEMAGVSWRTANKANFRLVETKLLTLITPATASFPNVWRLRFPPGDDADSVDRSSHSIINNVTECELLHHHNVFRWRALGKTGADVWFALQSVRAARIVELARVTGRHRRTVKRKLNLMFNLGMAEPLGDGHWRAVLGADLDQAAEKLGTSGMGERQRVRLVRDRRQPRLCGGG